jgi:PrcB C-terminal
MVRGRIFRLLVVSIISMIVAGRGGMAGSAGTPASGRAEGQNMVSLPFVTVAQGATPGGEGAQPSLRLVRTNEQRAALAARLRASDRPRLEAVHLSASAVIAAFQGLQPTSGYRIDILTVALHGKVLEVTVKRSSPAPGEPVRQGFESPYHVVQVAGYAFDAPHLTSHRLRDFSGDVLQEGPIDLKCEP